MSGHSKWANIKNRKGAQDKKRSEAFTKMSKIIMTAVRVGGGNTNPEANIGLKTAIDKARSVNMPKENIERLLKRFDERKNNLVTAMFEGFGPYGVPLMIEVETDNKNRVMTEIKMILRDYEANLGESGSVAFMFNKVGEIETNGFDEDKQLELIDIGATDFDDKYVYAQWDQLNSVKKKIEEMGIVVESAELIMKPTAPIELKTEAEVERIVEMIEALEENEDVINVFAGFTYHE
ncbi:MAG TPA: YebC/PmpR family DNA-binding transcriptional regulator [Candidatus Woesebacteria bacterium]|nr:YebC/PmpR family DNA-binding transcriptional regulator [Candidatus Woesebacteria bacterium]HPJ17176.1 YebC/PmpR family DNA-binding transcriptional regulator [Candidatus Woesebacteria bacterium]